MVDVNGCSGEETDGGCFSDEVDCGSCRGKVNVDGNKVKRGCGGGADGSDCETETNDDGCRGDIDGGGFGD